MTAISLVGRAHTLALFARGQDGVVIDTSTETPDVIECAAVAELLTRFNWTPAYPGEIALAVHQKAASALGSTVEVITPKPTRDRAFAVPKAVQSTARRALSAHVHTDSNSRATAELLSCGRPVTLAKIRQVASVLSNPAITPETAARQQFWGGNAGRKWALGVLERAGITAAAEPDPVPAEGESESIEIPEDATKEDILEILRANSEEVDPEEASADIANDLHAFTPTPGDEERCFWCGAPPDFSIHNVMDYHTADPAEPHFFQFQPDEDTCAKCGLEQGNEIHQLGQPRPGGETPEPEPEPTPEPSPVSASYRPSDVIDASPTLLAAVLSAEQGDENVRYYARMIPGGDDMVDGILCQDGPAWTEWSSQGNTWTSIEHPSAPIQLVDAESAYTLADQLSVFPEVSLRSLDLDERALFEAAREGLEAEFAQIDDLTYLAVAPDDDEVQYFAVRDPSDPNTATQLHASVNSMCFVWNYANDTWDRVDCNETPTGLSSPVSFDNAVLIARLQSRDGTAAINPPPEDSDLDQAADDLAETRFFNLFSGNLLDPPAEDFAVDDEGPPVDGLSEELFCYSMDPENPGQVDSLYVQLPDDSWLQWNALQVAWTPAMQPENTALVGPHEAAEFAAWQYDQTHDGSDEIMSTIQSEEFSAGFGKIFPLLDEPKSLHNGTTRPEIFFEDRAGEAIRVRDVPLRAAAANTTEEEDDKYTAEERSANAQKQVRDKFGRFAVSTARVVLPDNKTKGTIDKIDPDRQTVQVDGDDGKRYDVPADQVTVIDEEPPPATKKKEKLDPNRPAITFDPDQIDANPRATARTPKAFLPYTLPPMDAAAIKAAVENYQKFIESERAALEQQRRAGKKLGRAAG